MRKPLLDVPLELGQPVDSDVQRIVGVPHHRLRWFLLALVGTFPIGGSKREQLLLVIDQIVPFRLGRCMYPVLWRANGN